MSIFSNKRSRYFFFPILIGFVIMKANLAFAVEKAHHENLGNFLNVSHHQYGRKSINANNVAAGITINGSNGTIRFLKIIFYSDVNCTSPLETASVIDNSQGLPFTSGQTVQLNSSSVFQLANKQGVTPQNIRCMKVFLDASHESSKGIDCQAFTDINCTGTECISNQTKSVDWKSNPTACATTRYAYVANEGSLNRISKCNVSSVDGTLSNCDTTGGTFVRPIGVTINNGYIYVTDGSESTLSKCSVSAADGTLSGCVITGSTFNGPGGMTINNGYAYVANLNGNNVSKCNVSATDGSLDPCGTFNDNFVQPAGIIFDNNHAYVTNSGDNTVSKCDVSTSDGALSNCEKTGSTFSFPTGITSDNGYIYVANSANSTISKCDINTTDGTLSGCGVISDDTFSFPVGVTINNGYAYVANYDDSTVSKCAVSTSDGALSDCRTTDGTISNPNYSYIY